MNTPDFFRSHLDNMVDMRDRLRVLAERLPLLESQRRWLVICWVRIPWSSVRSEQCRRARWSVRGPKLGFLHLLMANLMTPTTAKCFAPGNSCSVCHRPTVLVDIRIAYPVNLIPNFAGTKG